MILRFANDSMQSRRDHYKEIDASKIKTDCGTLTNILSKIFTYIFIYYELRHKLFYVNLFKRKLIEFHSLSTGDEFTNLFNCTEVAMACSWSQTNWWTQ